MRERLPIVAAVAAGGALGALARWALFRFSDSIAGVTWYSTLAVNLIGCLAMGLFVGGVIRRARGGVAMRAFVTTGVLGGFTTFSAFAVDTARIGHDSLLLAIVYAVVTLAASVGLVWLGLRVTARRP